MTVKRFVAADMRRALDLVREEMGPDAIILSSQRTSEGVEIITSLDTDLPTRGADTRKEFGRRFDEELDSPLESDAAWQVQQGMEQAAAHYQAQPSSPLRKGGSSQQNSISPKRSEDLAREIEAARLKMLAAKRAEQPVSVANNQGAQSSNPTAPSNNRAAESNQAKPAAHSVSGTRSQHQVDNIGAQTFARSQSRRQADLESYPSDLQNIPQEQLLPPLQNSTQGFDNDYGPNGFASYDYEPQSCDGPVTANQAPHLTEVNNNPASVNPGTLNNWQPEDYQTAPAESGLDRQMAGLEAEIQQRAAEQAKVVELNSDRRLNDLHDQIADMRLLLEQQMWRMRDTQPGSVAPTGSLSTETITRHLEQLGLPEQLVTHLSTTATPGKHLSVAWRESLALLAHKIPADTSDLVNKGGVFAFVGPTGVGKTTTIAKLASRYVLEHGIGKVALITTDTYRVGAHDQLRALGRILNVPVRVVDRERPLATVVASLKEYPVVLVDTAGFRQGDPLLKEQDALLDSCFGLKRILVLAANSQKQNLKASAHAYGQKNLNGCVLTKLDETASLGEALGVVIMQKLPVMYMSDGQGIPKDISVGSAHNLVAKAVNIMKGQQDQASSVVGVS